MHDYKISKNLEQILKKLYKKDKKLYEQIMKKIDEIINAYNVEHYKNLQYNLKIYKRAHVGSFVLIFRYNKSENIIYFEDFSHHDDVYRRK